MTFRFASLTDLDQARHRENSWRQGLTKHKKDDEGGKGAVCWLREREKTKRTWGIFTRLEINYQFQLLSRPFFLGQCIIKQLLDSVFVISRKISPRLRRITPISTLIILDVTKTSSNNFYYCCYYYYYHHYYYYNCLLRDIFKPVAKEDWSGKCLAAYQYYNSSPCIQRHSCSYNHSRHLYNFHHFRMVYQHNHRCLYGNLKGQSCLFSILSERIPT